MRRATIGCVLLGVMMAGQSMASTVWNPAGNGITPPAVGHWSVGTNWTQGLPPQNTGTEALGKGVFNVPGAADCVVTNCHTFYQLVQGDNADGGVIRIANGGCLITDNVWSSVGYNAPATMIVETGGLLSFGQHSWIGFLPGSLGTVDIDGGTVTVAGMFGLGWSGGDGFVNVRDGGLLALSNIHGDGVTSIKQNSILDVIGTGQVTLPGDFEAVIAAYAGNGLIAGNGVIGAVVTDLTTNPGFTTVTGIPAPVDPPAAFPPLSIRHVGGSTLELAWPTGFGSYAAETTNDLVTTGQWAEVGSPVAMSSNEFTQVVTGDVPHAFYRLMASFDNTTLSNKSMMGYQGWFGSPTDASPVDDRWHHWGDGLPNITSWGIDFYPDMSEYGAAERYEPGWTLNNGDTAYLFSAVDAKSVEVHCRWMSEYGIDGVFLQRFLGEVQDSRFENMRDRVAKNIKAGCETYNRLYAMMYDVSGVADASMLGFITNDWNHLVTHPSILVTNSPSYAIHNGKPVVSIWGLGFKNRGLTPGTATAIINFFKNEGMTVMGGVPDSWRTLNGDSETDPAWATVYRSFDIISPWTVGRYNSLAGANAWRTSKIEPDLAAATAAGADYMPVIWPGFSWLNINGGPLNQIPRLGGDFYWRQAYNAQLSGCSMIYTAMFDEMDEGTAMLKMAETTNGLPAGASMVPLDADGISLPSDWYLQLGGEAARMLRGEIPLQSTIPISP